MYNNSIFIHAAILDKCKEKVLRYLDLINDSLLINYVNFVYICFVGSQVIPISDADIEKYNNNKNIFLIKISEYLLDYELPTLNFLHSFCKKNPECNVLYLHTKNVGKEINFCIEDQIEYMLHFLVTNWKHCIKKLIEFDTCGVDLRDEPTLHYSGNFWWSKADNIISLPSPTEFNNLIKYPNPLNSIRHNQEFWICHNKNKRFVSLWDCGISVYERHLHTYPRELYFNL